MQEMRLAKMEALFADLVWANAPMSTKDLVKLCDKELDWRRTTTYTVLRKLCDRGIFDMSHAHVSVLLTKEQFHAIQSQQLVEKNFQGSLPAFIAAFATRQPLSQKDLDEIRELIDSMDVTEK